MKPRDANEFENRPIAFSGDSGSRDGWPDSHCQPERGPRNPADGDAMAIGTRWSTGEAVAGIAGASAQSGETPEEQGTLTAGKDRQSLWRGAERYPPTRDCDDPPPSFGEHGQSEARLMGERSRGQVTRAGIPQFLRLWL